QWKSTTIGALTKQDGSFSIRRIPAQDTLVVSYVGYEPALIIRPTDNVDVALTPRAVDEDEVVVVAEQPLISRATTKTEVVTSRELTRAACCSLAESFERSPTVEVNYADAVSGARRIQMLGLSGLYSQTMIEAVPLIRSFEIPFGFDHIPGPFMESVSISKGAATVTTGYEGLTGTINVCQHDPMKPVTLYANAYANSMERLELNLYGSQQLSPYLSTMTMLHGRMQKATIDNNNDGFYDTPQFDQINAVHRWRFNDDKTEWQVYVRGVLDNYLSGQINMPTDSLALMRKYEIATNIKRLDGFIKYGLLNPFEDLDASGVSIVLGGAVHDQVSSFGDRTIDAEQNTLQARLVISAQLSDEISVIGGASYLYDDVRESLLTRAYSRTEHVPGVYAEATITPDDALTIVAGLRVDAHNMFGTRTTPRLHAKWMVGDLSSLRGSIGRGWRIPSVITENISSYINARELHFDETFRPEDGWNYGISYTTTLEIFTRPVTFDVEAYRTDFTNQVIIDYDRSVRELWVTNLDGMSTSTHIMAQALFSPVTNLDLVIAYRWLDVNAPFNGIEQQVPMVSTHRVLLTVGWQTSDDEWQMDGTVVYNGSGRLPTTAGNPVEYQRPTSYDGWWRVNAQITKRFDNVDVYLGSENLTNFILENPIIATDDPFGTYFDASLAYAPTVPRMVYVGLRVGL
ncbi:MAG: hypothetical protein EHM43_10160, partial [Ignavibacteriae bacterium]